MAEKPFKISFDKLREKVLPICIDYGRLIIKEALSLPESNPSFYGGNFDVSPIVNQHRSSILEDKRFKKAVPLFYKLDFFQKFNGRFLMLESYIFEILPINFLLMLLEYVLSNPSSTRVKLRFQKEVLKNEPQEYEIDKLNEESINYALDLLEKLLVSSSVTYTIESMLVGVKARFDSVQLGEYILTQKSVPLKTDKNGQPITVGLISVRKSISIGLENLVFDTLKDAIKATALSFRKKDPAMEFAEFMGFMMASLGSYCMNLHLYESGDYEGIFFGSLGAFLNKDGNSTLSSTERGKLSGIAIASLKRNMPELEEKYFTAIQENWDALFYEHIKLDDNVRKAVRRMGMSSIRRDPEDKLIDLIVGFEGLIGMKSKYGNNRNTIGIRASLLIKDRKDSYGIIDEAYSMRNKLLHSGKEKITEEKLTRVIEKLTPLLGLALFEYTSLYRKNHFQSEDEFIKYLDDTLFKETQKIIHGSSAT